MNNQYQKYPHYKSSGVQWLGDIPEHWEILKLKILLQDGKDGIRIGPFGSAIKNEILKNQGFKIYGQEHVIANDFTIGEKYIDENDFNKLANYELFSGDIVITMMGTTGKCKVVPSEIKKGIMDSHLIRVRINSFITNSNFVALLINDSNYIFQQIKVKGKGSIMEGLNSSIIKSLLLILPPLPEQTAISQFLDRKTAQIDMVISQKQRMIELLKERRQILIHQAVTRGLHPNVPMKDSGVEWIGEIPAHWEVTQIKKIAQTTSGGTPPSGNIKEYYNGHIPWVRTTDLNNDELYDVPEKITDKAIRDTACKVVPINTVCVAMYGGPGSIGKHSILRFSATLNQALCGIIPSKKLYCEFLYYYVKFCRPYWMINAKGTRVDPNISQDEVRKMSITLPPKSEQFAIAEHIETATQKIATAIGLKEQEIEKLKEYKASLINSVVTGKVKVTENPEGVT